MYGPHTGSALTEKEIAQYNYLCEIDCAPLEQRDFWLPISMRRVVVYPEPSCFAQAQNTIVLDKLPILPTIRVFV